MENYLLDTNHAAAWLRLGHPLRQRVLLRLQAGDTFAITVPVITETLYGIGLLPRGTQNLAEWARLRPSLAIGPRHLSDACHQPGVFRARLLLQDTDVIGIQKEL